MKTILFRADSSSTIGTGHIMRDLVLAKQYPQSKIIFATQNLEGNLNSKILESGYEVQNLDSNDVNELIELVQKLSVDMVIVDHYGIDYMFEKMLKEKTAVELMVLDDTYEKHYCDILLNHNIYAEEQWYKGLIPEYCELRCGAKYTLLRDEFMEQKSIKTILVAMGGADHSNINIPILEVLSAFKHIEVNLVTTSANQHLDKLKAYVEDKSWISLYIDSNEIAKLMRVSDFAIVTPSVTLNEVFFMELPFIAIQTADNQGDMVQYLIENRYSVLKQFNAKVLKAHIDNFLKPKLINFTDVSLEDKKMVLAWRNHPSVRKWMFSKDKIALNEHLAYIELLKTKKDRAYFLLKAQGNPIGVIDFTEIDLDRSQASIGLFAKPNLRGVGKILMQEILDYGFNQLKVKTLRSEVFEGNDTAIKLYKRHGFKEVERRDNIIVMELKNENR